MRILLVPYARSCGLTTSAFGSLFFSAKQLLGNSVGRLTNGSDFEQLWNNPNVLLFGLGWIGGKGSHGSSSTSLLSRYFLKATERDVLGLEAMLTRVDGADDLPRVLFCNCTWVLNDVDIMAGACESNYIKDHQFAIVKHSNDNFQCVQGYKQTSPVDDGYCLSSWQQSQSRYSDREGFSLTSNRAHLPRLRQPPTPLRGLAEVVKVYSRLLQGPFVYVPALLRLLASLCHARIGRALF